MRVVFMGTPDFAVGTLEALVKDGHEIVGVVTQPDKPKGRGKTMQETPVKETARKYQLSVYQPKKVRDTEFIEVLKQLKPQVMVVAAFGQLIPREILELPPLGCVNVHASLLPAYRGAAPIQWAVLNGEKETGVTIMQMDEGLDTGDMLDKVVIPLEPKETGGSLFVKLSTAGAELCVKVLRDLEAGICKPKKQPEESTTAYARMIDKKMGEIAWEKSAKEIEQLIRGLNPWPSAYTKIHNKLLKIWSAEVLEGKAEAKPGEVVQADKDGLVLQTGDGCLKVLELQLEGKKRMDAPAFLRGCCIQKGEVLGK